MKGGKMRRILSALIIILSLPLTDSFAQSIRMGSSAKEGNVELYEKKASDTVSGKITGVGKVLKKDGKTQLVWINVKSDSDGETYTVHFCPGWYFESNKMRIESNQWVLVKGSKTMHKGVPVILASEIAAYATVKNSK